MNDENSLLDEFQIDTPKKGKLFDSLLLTSISFIVVVMVNLFIDLNKFSIKQFDWDLVMMILVLPLLGIIFHLKGKRIGWIINFCYYLFFSSIAFCALYLAMSETKNNWIKLTNWQGPLMLLLALASTCILLTRSIRKYFRISNWLFFCTIAITLGLTITIFFLGFLE